MMKRFLIIFGWLGWIASAAAQIGVPNNGSPMIPNAPPSSSSIISGNTPCTGCASGGVLYNGSDGVTAGSALTFDGTTLLLNGNPVVTANQLAVLPLTPANGGSGIANSTNLAWVSTAGQTYTFPTTTATLARTDAAQTFVGVQTFAAGSACTAGNLSIGIGSSTIGLYQVTSGVGICGPVTTNGNILSGGNIQIPNASLLDWSSRSLIASPADGVVQISNHTSSNNVNFYAGGFIVSALPVGPPTGSRTYVTDQLTTCAGVGIAPTGGGAVTCPVFYNGSAWVGG